MKSPIVADRFFTNRENHFISFNKALDRLEPNKCNVLSFYGVGGVGKTRLKKELIKTIKEQKQIIVSSSLDFYQLEHKNVSTAVHLLYQELKSKKIQFPTFEIAHAIFWQKVHPDQQLSKSGLPYVEEGSIVFDLISIINDIPLVGVIPKLGTIIYKAKEKYQEWWTKNGERELNALQSLEPRQIEEALLYYFSLDLNFFLEHSNSKVVFFIDTYESLWGNHEERKKERFFAKDRWVRDLIEQLPGTLWVILGREKLRWEEVEDQISWHECLEQHLLGNYPLMMPKDS
ncbi:hypothetical protein [Dyadobacter sp. CY347]|uniref:hypothetical protein n=1 Tax=Dyadobacter sp. CY347 TaxID=2909336 RepID=UPI001F3F4D27|nr:hypothetical protein [Dyadobacter sp. CY347]MCF2490794.1 hypothetical protein [Dyadobacter sp. CY347]